MTNGWIDIKNTDMMLIMGGNPAENHPCGFKWVVEAKRNRNAHVIVVDPRFTRTASQADLFCQIRAGSDIAFLGGVISYAIQNNRVAHEYLVNYTNAAFIVKEGFKLPEDGLFSGFNADTKTYDKSTWNYQEGGNETGKLVAAGTPATEGAPKGHEPQGSVPRAKEGSVTHHGPEGQGYQPQGPAGAKAIGGGPIPPPSMPEKVAYDLSLQHPRCVYQLLKQQYSRYTPEMVERITGIPKDQFLKAADMYTSIRKDGDTKKVGDHHLRSRLDAAQLRHADHPHCGDAAVADGQCRTRRRRRQRPTRALQHPGRNRYGRHLRHPSGISENAHPCG